jgi:carbamoyl-phosphate synthase large subunit
MGHRAILVSAVGGDLGQSVIRCLRDCKPSLKIVGCDMNRNSAGRVAADFFLQSPPAMEQGHYIAFLSDTFKKFAIDRACLLSEPEILFYNSHRHLFSGMGVDFLVNSKTIIDDFSDKYRTILFFKEKGLPYPETYLQEEYSGQLHYPLVLKQRSGSGGAGLVLVHDNEELSFHLKRKRNMVVQEYIPGDDLEYTAGIFCDGITVHVICFRRRLAPGGYSREIELVNEGPVREFIAKVGYLLNFKGSVNLQFRETGKGFVPFEINPRFSSTVYFRHLLGFQDVLWSLMLLENQRIDYTPKYKKAIGVRGYREIMLEME